MDWASLLSLLKDKPEYMLIALIVIIIMYFLVRMSPQNRIGSVKGKRIKIRQSGKKRNEIQKTHSKEDIEIEQN